MIKLSDISKEFGDKKILNNISLILSNNHVYGLIGENGTGKTTLLKIILGQVSPDDGLVDRQREVIGYVPQNPEFPNNSSVRDYLKEKILAEDEWYKVETILAQTGLDNSILDTPSENLSGGQKTRLHLAALLLQDPSPTFLLLDEPTNNLDIDGIIWLEEFITSFDGTILIVSHDRALLDNVVDTIFEIENSVVKTYGGNYSFYQEQKEIERQAYERNFIAQQKKIYQIEENIAAMKQRAQQGETQFSSRMPYQRRKIRKSAEQAVHRQQALQKFLQSEQKLEKPETKKRYLIQLKGESHTGKTVLYAKNISKSFGNKQVLDKISLHIQSQERVWLTGKNGSGKSTLLKILTDTVEPDSGTVEIGNAVSIGYFSQEQSNLDRLHSVQEELMSLDVSQTEAYKLALRFNFKPEDLSKKLSELSMGQHVKITFAKLTYGHYNILILDEPTNHLEISTRETLEQILQEYRGALLISSHDRFFLENIQIQRIIELS